MDVSLFEQMLSSFEQDIEFKVHIDFDSLLAYAGGVANSFGRLMLKICHADTAKNIDYSDAICTSLLMADFLQDVAADWKKGRVYFPATHMQAFGVTAEDLEAGNVDHRWRSLVRYEISIARQMMLSGAPLAQEMRGRFRPELCIIIQAGLRIFERIEQLDYDVFRQHKMLRQSDWILIFYRSIVMICSFEQPLHVAQNG